MAKKTIDQFLRLEHEIWEYKMPPLAKLMLIAIYRWTAGFHRNKCKISDATITEMTGIKTPYPHRKFLIENDYIKYHHTDGTTGIYEIPPNIINRSKKQPPNRIDSTPKFNEGDPLIELNGYREAKENIKENLKKESGTLSDDLINELKSKYPNIDVDAVKDKMLKYYNGKDIPVAYKLREWCETERPTKVGAAGMDVNDVIKIIVRKIDDVGSYKQPTFNDDEKEVEKIVKQIGWGNLCRMDEYELRSRVKSLND